MPNVPDAASVAAKWNRRTSGATTEYQTGVQTTPADWAKNTVAAKDAYSQGVQAAIASDQFSKGVNRAGTDKWKRKTIELGVNRWPQGVQAAQAEYQSGVSPYLDTIKATTLPARGRRGDPKNIERTRVLAAALHDRKVKG